MSKPQSTMNKDEAAAPASPAVERHNSDDAKSTNSEVKELITAIKNLSQKRRVFRQVQLNYIRIKKSFFKHIKPLEEAADKSESQKDP